nr:tetratricopeptide repeat protein [Motiliproteus sediminis]
MRTEEEQIEAIKNWWKENGRSTVLGVALAAVAVFGWRTYQDFEQQKAETASAIYQNLTGAIQLQPGEELPQERRATAEHLAGQLKSDFSASAYAQFAALWLAKSAVEAGELDRARQELEWVLAQQPEPEVQQVASQRLARVLAASEQYPQALAALGDAPRQGFEATFYEIKGDILLHQGDIDGARRAYRQGIDLAGEEPRPILTMKLDDLAVAEES